MSRLSVVPGAAYATVSAPATGGNATTMASKTRKRLQVDFDGDHLAKLRELKELSGERSNTNAIRRAVRFHRLLLAHGSQGYRIQLVKGDHIVEVAVP